MTNPPAASTWPRRSRSYHLMNQLKQRGIGVLFVSSEMPEILGMADRILVMRDGRVTGEYTAAEASRRIKSC